MISIRLAPEAARDGKEIGNVHAMQAAEVPI
jgi:hypothetical protein